MSVKVVSPTDPGQPELPMSLRPQPAPAGGRSRQCLTPGQEPRHRPAADSRQPQLPIPQCPSAAAEPKRPLPAIPEQTRPPEADAGTGRPAPADSGQLELSAADESRSVALEGSPRPPEVAVADPAQLELSAADQSRGQAASSSAARPVSSSAASGRLEPAAVADAPQGRPREVAVADPGQLELSAADQSRRPAAPSSAARPASSTAASDRPEPGSPEVQPPVVATVAAASGLPIPAAPAGESELPMELRPPGADSDQSQLPMSLRPPASPAAAGLLAQARRGLAEAAQESRPAERFIGAYLAALRGAAAVLAARGRPHRGRARPASTWTLLDSVAPELREWSAFFASNSATRAAAQAGITGKVTAESAAGLVGAATPFLELVRRLVHGLPITGEAHVA